MLRAHARWASTAARRPPQLPWGLTRRFERRLPVAEVRRVAPLTPLGLLNRPTWQPNEEAQALRSYVDALASPRDAHIVAVMCGATMLDDGGITAEAAAVSSGSPAGPLSPPPASGDSASSSGYSVESRTVGPVSRRGRRRGSIVAGSFPPATAASHPAAAAAEAAAAAAASSPSSSATAAAAGADADGDGAHLPRGVQLFLDGAREVFLTLFARGLPGVHDHYRAVRAGGPAGAATPAAPTAANAGAWLPSEARELLHGTIIEALAVARKQAQEAAAEVHAAAAAGAAAGTSTASTAQPVSVPAVAITEVRDVKIVDTYAVWDGTLTPDDLGDGAVQARERGHSVALVTDTSRMNAIERLLTATAHFYQLHPARAVVAQLTVAFTCVETHDGVRVGTAVGDAPAAGAAAAGAATTDAQAQPLEKLTVHTLTFESAVEDDEASPPLLGRLMAALPMVRYLRTPVLRPTYGWRVVDIDGHFSPVGGSGVPGALGVSVPRGGGLTFSDLLPRGVKLATQRAHDEVEEIVGRVRGEAPLFEAVAVEADALAEAVEATADALRRAGPGGAAALEAPPGASADADDAGALFSGDKDAGRAPGVMLSESARLLRFVARAARVMGSTSRPPWVARAQAEAEWEAAVDAGGSWRVPRSAVGPAAVTTDSDSDSDSDETEASAAAPAGPSAATGSGASTATPAPTGDLTDDTPYETVSAGSVVPRFSAAKDSSRTVAWLTRRMRYAVEGGGAPGSGGAMSASDRLALQTYTLVRKRMESYGGERVAADADYELAWKLARNLCARGVYALLSHRLKPLAEAHVGAGRPEAGVYGDRAELLSGLPKELLAASDRLESPQAAAAMGAVREAMGRVQAEATGGGGGGGKGDDDAGDDGEEEEDGEVAAALAGDCSRVVSDYRPTGRRPPSAGGPVAGWYRSLYGWADRTHGMLEGLQRLAGDMASAGLLQQQAPPSAPPRGGGGGGDAPSLPAAAAAPAAAPADHVVGRRAARARAAAARQAREQEEQQRQPPAEPPR